MKREGKNSFQHFSFRYNYNAHITDACPYNKPKTKTTTVLTVMPLHCFLLDINVTFKNTDPCTVFRTNTLTQT